ncbi:MAG: pyridoxamine 5'-phosphate oxidase family protein [Nitriliruptorales bacterium]|nr:pyridoxamine 5'-phosphate oxidase family protein [Nitriliruptorales bacterium]
MRLVYVRDAEGNLREHLEPVDAAAFEAIDLEASLALLRRNTVGRVAFLSQDRPVILPVTYGVDENDAIVFRTAPGSKLHIAETEIRPVVFEVDEYDHDTGRGAGVVVHGPMDAVLNQVEAAHLDSLDVKPYADAIPRQQWVRIRPRKLQGWSFARPPRQTTA